MGSLGLRHIGGLLLIAGAVLAAVSLVIGDQLGTLDAAGTQLILPVQTVFVSLLGAGAAAVSIAGRWPFDSRLAQVALGLTAIGLLGLAVGSLLIAFGLGDPASGPGIVVSLIAVPTAALGAILTGLVLAELTGAPRAVGAAIAAGVPVLFLGSLLAPSTSVGLAIAGLGFVLLLMGFAGLGLLAIRGPGNVEPGEPSEAGEPVEASVATDSGDSPKVPPVQGTL